jgi:hypothetical protein
MQVSPLRFAPVEMTGAVPNADSSAALRNDKAARFAPVEMTGAVPNADSSAVLRNDKAGADGVEDAKEKA